MTEAGWIRIGSRGSALALWQANHIAQLLEGRGYKVEIEVIKTTGDRMQEVTFAEVGTKGMFTLEIEDALRAGRIDLAVHSLKDLPTELPEGFVLAATPKRADARDVFVSAAYARLADLPSGARVGTSSLRRRAMLKAMRPDLKCMEFRGNVDTRLRKLGEGQAEAILLAGAGVDRLDKTEWVRERLEPEAMCPAPGQGALGIEARAGDGRVLEALKFLDDAATRFAVTAERAALAALGGGCQVPIGVYCRAVELPPSQNRDGGHPGGGRLGEGIGSFASLEDDKSVFGGSSSRTSQERDVQPDSEVGFEILGAVGDPEGERVIRSRCEGSAADGAEKLGRMLAEDLKRQGAAELIAAVVAS